MIRIGGSRYNQALASLARIGIMASCLIAVGGCGSDEATAPSGTLVTDPARAVFVTSDIEHFWKAYDAGGVNGTSAPFQTEYLDRASPGLGDFIRSRNLTAASLASMVRLYPRYFADIRASTLRLATDAGVLGRIRDNYRKIADLYPPAVFPPVTFLIGRFSTGGTTSAGGMLVGLEFFSITPTTPLDELGRFQRDNVRPLDSLPVLVAHEHAHILQGRAGGIMIRTTKTLLDQSLLEGGADFVTYVVTGQNSNSRLQSYGIPHEAELWAEFKAAMHGTDLSQWLYNQGTATGDRPGDLGYFIGYRIAESFYARTADKKLALRAIIEIGNSDLFLTQSGYAP